MKRLIIGIVSLLVLTIITVFVAKQQGQTTVRDELSDFAVKDTSLIGRVVLQDETKNRVELQRQPSGHWTVNGEHKARPDAINILLTTIRKVNLKSPVSQEGMQTVLKNIISKHTLVEIYDRSGDLVKEYYVGGPTQEHTGTFMLLKNSSRPFITHIEGHHGFLTTRYFTNELEWRHRGVFEYRPDQLQYVEVAYPQTPSRSFRIENNGDDTYTVFMAENPVPGNRIDTLMLDAYLQQYKMVHYESYEETKTETFLDSVKQSPPIFQITVATKSGEERTVTGFKKPLKKGYDYEGNEAPFDLERMYIWVDSNELLIGQYAIFDKLTKGVYFFKNR